MIDVNNIWPTMVDWMSQIPVTVRTLNPAILVMLAAPCVLALVTLNRTALLLTVLLVAIALVAFRIISDEPVRWVVAGLTCMAGLLAVLQATQLRRRRGQLRRMETVLEDTRRELGEVREKYEGEVYWRRAGERVASQENG